MQCVIEIYNYLLYTILTQELKGIKQHNSSSSLLTWPAAAPSAPTGCVRCQAAAVLNPASLQALLPPPSALPAQPDPLLAAGIH